MLRIDLFGKTSLRIQKRTLWPFSAMILAITVPKLPPPMTATSLKAVLLFVSVYALS